MSGLTTFARRERWQHFATLTFCNPVPGDGGRKRMLFAWLRTVAELRGLPYQKLLWLTRAEEGEITGRHHYHILLTGLDPSRVNTAANFILMNAWEKLGGGMARVYIFNQQLSGVGYVLKGLEELDSRANDGANAYEIGKFEAVEKVTGLIPARALLRKWGGRAEPNRRHRKAHEMRAHQCDRATRRTQGKPWKPAEFPHPADLAGRTVIR